MNKVEIHIDQTVIDDLKRILHGSSTVEGIDMLGLKSYDPSNNMAGNKYISALRTVEFLMKQLGIENQLYE